MADNNRRVSPTLRLILKYGPSILGLVGMVSTRVISQGLGAGLSALDTLTVENKGGATATNTLLTTSLTSAITQKTCPAASTGSATGMSSGTRERNTSITLAANGSSRGFTPSV